MEKRILNRLFDLLGRSRSDAESELLRRAHARFEEENPEWASSLFDWHFVTHRAVPIIRGASRYGMETAAARIARAWAEQWDFGSDLRDRAARRAMPAARTFLELLCAVQAESGSSGRLYLPDFAFCTPQLSLEQIARLAEA